MYYPDEKEEKDTGNNKEQPVKNPKDEGPTPDAKIYDYFIGTEKTGKKKANKTF